MTDYISLRIDLSPCNEDITDLLAAFLADIGYESFEPDVEGLTAYIKSEDYSGEAVAEALASFPIDVRAGLRPEFVKGQNWNEEWEKHYFNPIVVGGRVAVHSSFHKNVPEAEYDIVIDPKMAFGTGHHSTTSLMLRLILSHDMEGKSVIDMGTGTGILAILAGMRGAADVTGVDIEPDAVDNAIENATLNNVEVRFIAGDSSVLAGLKSTDYFFANINRNVLLADMSRYALMLNEDGKIFLSGFYEEDIPLIKDCGAKNGLELRAIVTDNRWAAVELEKAACR